MEVTQSIFDDEIKSFLDEKVDQFNRPGFVENDPISIPHRYSRKEDIEISAFLVATISWGNREVIVRNGHRMLDLLGVSPFDFIMAHNSSNCKSSA